MCNILLRQGRVSPELRAKTIDLLGSDIDKEAFFREFELFDQLCSFYEAKEQYRDLFELCLSIGDLTTALDAVITHRLDSVSDNDVEKLFNYVVAESIFIRRGLVNLQLNQGTAQPDQVAEDFDQITEQSERSRVLLKKAHSLPILEKAASHWEKAFLLFASVDNPNTSISLSDLQKGLARQFFCLFTIAFEPKIFSRSKVSFLPTHLFLQATQLLQDLTSEEHPPWLYMLCGLFEPPGRDTIVLPWSPLRKEIPEGADSLSTEGIFQYARRWILDKFSSSIRVFDETAQNLLKSEFNPSCVFFLIRGEQYYPNNAPMY